MKNLRYLLSAILAVVCALPSLAVTDKEMDQARAFAAQAYLRYVNDGSGYLDDLKPSSMAQLESNLRQKEKENLKAFNSVKIPGDYASWDKSKLVEFWSITFFASPNLESKGKLAKSKVREKVSAMTIGAQEAPEAKPAQTDSTPTPAEKQEIPEVLSATPEVVSTDATDSILADQEALAQDLENRKTDNSSTWIYVVVLVILLAVVIWLVVFAANMMKAKPEENDSPRPDNTRNPIDPVAPVIPVTPIKTVDTEKYISEIRALENENSMLRRNLQQLQEEIAQLNSELQSLRLANTTNKNEARTGRNENAASNTQPAEMPKVIYLGRVNKQGLFVRADRNIIADASIFRLDTTDGNVGTFHVVDHPRVVAFAISNPSEFLENGCVALDLDNTAGVSHIITEAAGTAILENGRWKVLRKTRIRYE